MPISEIEMRQGSALDPAIPFGKPTLPVMVPAEYSRSNDARSTAQIEYACRVINLTGCRLVPIDGLIGIGAWQDLDGPELRSTFKILGLGSMAVVHLEALEAPIKFKYELID